MTLRVILGPHCNSEDNAIIHLETGEDLLKSGKIGWVKSIRVSTDYGHEVTTVSAELLIQRTEVTPGRFELCTPKPPIFRGSPEPIAKIIFQDGTEWDVEKEFHKLTQGRDEE